MKKFVMTKSGIEQGIKEALSQYTKYGPERMAVGDSLLRDIPFDSLDLVAALVDIEDGVGSISLDGFHRNLNGTVTVGDLVTHVVGLVGLSN
jgi:acyl carrier protein